MQHGVFSAAHIFAQILSSETKKCNNYFLTLCLQTAKRVYKIKRQYMNMLTFCSIRYMNEYFFFEDQVYDWEIFQKKARTPVLKITPKLPPTPEG